MPILKLYDASNRLWTSKNLPIDEIAKLILIMQEATGINKAWIKRNSVSLEIHPKNQTERASTVYLCADGSTCRTYPINPKFHPVIKL